MGCERIDGIMNPIFWMLIETVGSLLASACMLRAYAWSVHLTPHNPLSQFLNALTDWLVKPLSRLVAPSRKIMWPALIAGALVALLVTIAFFLLGGHPPQPGPVLLKALIYLVRWTLYLAIGILILMAIISLINPYAPLAPAFNQLADPILRPIRKIVPLVGNFDLSPLIAIILIQVLLALIR